MKKYLLGFLAVIVAAVLTGGLLAGYREYRRQNSAAEAGYNLTVENQLEDEVEQIEILYEADGERYSAKNRTALFTGESACFRLDVGELDYRMVLRVAGQDAVEAELSDDFRGDVIVRYWISREDGRTVLRKEAR